VINMSHFYAEKIRRHRQRMGLSQQQLGERMGVSAVAVSKWERGQSQPDIPTLTALADLFGMTLDELCGRREEEPGNITLMARAMGRMTPEEQEKVLAVGKALFAHAFSGEEDA